MKMPDFLANARALQSTVMCTATLLIGCNSVAQSMLVIGNSGYSRECFTRAELSVSLNSADADDVEVCSKALQDMNLSLNDRAATLVNRGILQLSSGQFDAAKASYDAALNLVENQGETHINIANIYVMQKRYEDAVQQYTKGIPLMTRRQHIGFLNRGLAFEYMKDFSAAQSDYERAIELAPEWVRAKKMLARVKLKRSGRT